MDDMMTDLSQRMESVLQPTHCMVSDISRRLTTLEQKVADMDIGWKKEVAALKEVLKSVATGVELFPLTERVVLIEEHLRHVRHVLKLTDDDDDDEQTTSCQHGGKRLRCDSSVRAESSPGTLAVSGPSLRDRNELPSPDTTSPVGTQSSCASTSEIRHVRGSTRGLPYSRLAPGGKLTDDFQLDYDRAEDRFTVTSTMNTAYRTHRNRMFQHYSVFNSKEKALEHPYPEMNKEEWTRVCDLFASEEFQRRSAINKENRAKLKIVHTSGARSFQRMRALLKNPESNEISAALLYKKTHTNKDGMWTSEDARENFEKMEALQLQYESEGKSYTEVEIFAEVLGTKAGYVRGLGRSVRFVGSSSSVSSVDLSRKLEEARLQIEEMRARQLEYEALLVKWSDMEQTMREHLQMMEEQQ
ncbi:hypothetical protein CJ030_MR5G003550 [Morella rubra]|uniref:Uncharacterized protein n=1 Tax=Morella rubra TaxID=262757 RepID=A0A6A1VRP5_9ROSI|nr:hypothetical protein CJ030_MR5G003550 [Morella rubra]